MNKVLIGSVLAAGLLVTGSAQADTEDALLGGLFGVALGIAISNDDDRHHGHVVHHYRSRPVHYYHYTPPRRVHHYYHPSVKQHKYHKRHGRHVSRHDRRDWDRGRDRHRRWRD